MDFTAGSIALTIFTGVVAGFASYFAAYMKGKAEVRAATEDLQRTIDNLRQSTQVVELVKANAAADAVYLKVKTEVNAATEVLQRTIDNLRQTTQAVELEKAKIAAEATLASDQRKAVYALASTTQSLIHSMCWLSWDTKARKTVRVELAKMYDTEAHKLIPELFGQMAVIQLLDRPLYKRATHFITNIVRLDVKFGEAIIASEVQMAVGADQLAKLYDSASALFSEAESVFGVDFQLAGATRKNANDP